MPAPAPNCLSDVILAHNLERRHLMRRNNDERRFGYEGENGPEHWGEFNATCQIGHRQSPVNFDNEAFCAPEGERPDISAWPTKLMGPIDFINLGHTVQVNIPVEDRRLFATKQLDGRTYYLQQFHFHVPSEHHVYGRFFPAELHFVHASDDGRLSVVGFFLKNAFDSDEFFGRILPELPTVQTPLKIVNLNFEPIIKSARLSSRFWKYEGSLTVPPCTEGIYWTVAKDPIPVSFSHLQRLGDTLGFTARPTQNNSYVEDKLK
ncbi:hypothetical protein HDU67_007951 [Dinochytrium kinnereticum]|nr:hypothetical protein HDU67_007951 [Dinochytrium kinnereticum]